ncbi:MAG: hypothetical protein ACP5I6_00075 [Caldisphaera sp.]|jgi:protein-disulfide isomerase|nr:MAG: hypothetical protein C0201_00075 [Caldisphaera sp.]
MDKKSRSLSGSTLAVIIVVIVVVVVAAGAGAYYATRKPVTTTVPTTTTSVMRTTTTSTSTSAPVVTTSQQLINIKPLLVYINSSLMPGAGNISSKYYIFIVYDPECPYCAIELNQSLPYFYYLANNGYARLEFVGMPIHEYSLEMLAMLDLIYQKYGFQQFYNVLDQNYAYYVHNILLYENNVTKQLQMPTPYTIYEIMNRSGLSINLTAINQTMKNAYSLAETTYNQGIEGVPVIIVYNSTSGNTLYQFIGLYPENEVENQINQTLGLK